MYRLVIMSLLLVHCIGSHVNAQDDVAALRNRIAELETENRKLRGLVIMLAYAQKVQDGVLVNAAIDDTRSARIVVARDGWGEGRPHDVAKVCVSVAEIVFSAIKPDKGREPTIFVIRDANGPMVVSQRGPSGEYFVLLSAGERHWSQVAYQFSHELGHVLCGDLSLEMLQHWFEESFCESMSLWTMDKMGDSWRTNPPYDNWKDYAQSLTSYANDVRTQVKDPDNLADWFHDHRAYLSREAYDRDKNLVLAKKLADQAHRNPKFYQAFYYLRRGEDTQVNSMEWLLANWHNNCPEKLRFAPSTIAELLNVTAPK